MSSLEFRIVQSDTNEIMYRTSSTIALKLECKRYVDNDVDCNYHIEAWDDVTCIDEQSINTYFDF